MQASARAIGPLLLGGAIALVPAPEGLAPAAWHYFALFVTVITLIITEPIPPAAIGMAGVTAAAVLGLVHETPRASAEWALSGFGNRIVWLIFAAFMFTVGYAQTGLGRRIALQLVRAAGTAGRWASATPSRSPISRSRRSRRPRPHAAPERSIPSSATSRSCTDRARTTARRGCSARICSTPPSR